MMHTLEDYSLKFHKVPIMCDNTNAIMISKNPVLRDHIEKGDIELIHIDTKN